MEDLSKRFPPGLKYTIVYNPTQFIQQSVDAVESTIGEAIILVVLVVMLFLQTWRAAIIPIVAIPVSLIGTFFVMAMFGFTLNNLSLFGLVLAIGIVVDDAIVVVENVERNIEAGLSPRDAAVKSMDEVGAALIAIALVLIVGVRAVRLHHRHFRTVLPAVRAHHRRRHHHFADRVADAVAGAVRAAAQAARAKRKTGIGGAGRFAASSACSIAASTCSDARLWLAVGARWCAFAVLMLVVYAGVIGFRPQRIPQDAGRLHPAARPRLSHHRHAIAAGARRWRAPTRSTGARSRSR